MAPRCSWATRTRWMPREQAGASLNLPPNPLLVGFPALHRFRDPGRSRAVGCASHQRQRCRSALRRKFCASGASHILRGGRFAALRRMVRFFVRTKKRKAQNRGLRPRRREEEEEKNEVGRSGIEVGVAIGIGIAIEIAIAIDPFPPTVRSGHDHAHANSCPYHAQPSQVPDRRSGTAKGAKTERREKREKNEHPDLSHTRSIFPALSFASFANFAFFVVCLFSGIASCPIREARGVNAIDICLYTCIQMTDTTKGAKTERREKREKNEHPDLSHTRSIFPAISFASFANFAFFVVCLFSGIASCPIREARASMPLTSACIQMTDTTKGAKTERREKREKKRASRPLAYTLDFPSDLVRVFR